MDNKFSIVKHLKRDLLLIIGLLFFPFALLALDITGQVQLDSTGTGSASSTVISGATVRLYNSTGTFMSSTTTDSSGNYSFLVLATGVFYVSVAAPTTGGMLPDQTYATAGTGNGGSRGGSGYGPICATDYPAYAQQSSTTPSNWTANNNDGTCFGGRQGAVADTSSNTLTQNEHVTRINIASILIDVTGVNFGFSYNVVTNINNTGQGSFRQFLTNSNASTTSSSMRFVPAVTMNQTSGANSWWRVALTSVLPTLTGANGANTTVSGTAYSNADGATVLTPNAAVIQAAQTVGYGSSQTTLSAFAALQLEINAPTTSTYTAVVGTTTSSTTIQNIALTGGYSTTVWAGAGSSGFILQNSAIGVNPLGTVSAQSQTGAANAGIKIGDLTNSTTDSGLSGTITHNVIRSAGANITLYGLTGVTSGQYTISNNFANGVTGSTINGINLLSSPNINITSNYVTAATGVGISLNASSGGVITGNSVVSSGTQGIYFTASTSNGQIIGNLAQSNGSTGIRIDTTSNNNLIQANQSTSNGSAGVGIASNSNGNQITQNIFGANTGNAIDLNVDGVTINSTACVNSSGATTGNSGLARPVILGATLDSSSTLNVTGTLCATGAFTIQIYQATAGTGDTGSDSLAAGEGTVYVGSLTAQSGGIFRGTLTGLSGISAGTVISAIAIRTTTGGTGVVGDTSEFAANLAVTNPNFGSAPNSYLTLKASSGAEHQVVSGISLGPSVPTSADGQPVTAPAAALGGSSVASFPVLTNNTTSYSVNVLVNNTGSQAATLVGWIDFNRNGVFDPAEGVSLTIPAATTSGTFTLTWSNVQALSPTLGVTYARFRISTDSTLSTSTPGGLMQDGEVEDYGGTGVLQIVGSISVSGTVYNDLNYNGILSSNETGSGQTLYAKLVTASGSTCGTTASQAVAVNTTTGVYTLINVLSGSYCVVISTTNSLTSVAPSLPSGWYFTGGGNGNRLVTTTAMGNISGVNFGISNTLTVSGLVFRDSGGGSATAYDGIQQTGESIINNALITVTGNQGSTTVYSNDNGTFSVPIPSSVSNGSGNLSIVVTPLVGMVSVSKGVTTFTDGATATQYNTVTLTFSNASSGGSIRFGLVPIAQFQPNTIENDIAGSAVFHPYQLRTSSPGTVTFSVASQVSIPTGLTWITGLYTDSSCNGSSGSSGTIVSAPVAVAAGQNILCVAQRVLVPKIASPGNQLVQTLQASFTYGSTGVVTTTTVTGTTLVTQNNQLNLIKTVNQTSAIPGQTLTYTVSYNNLETATLQNVVIQDSVTQYTSLVSGSAQCVTPLPTGITCTVNTSNLPIITWTLTGGLLPGAAGSVIWQVTIN